MGVLVVFSWRPETPERHKKSSKICIINFSGYAFPKTMILQGIRRPMSGDLKFGWVGFLEIINCSIIIVGQSLSAGYKKHARPANKRPPTVAQQARRRCAEALSRRHK
jgi:hypothetical protein